MSNIESQVKTAMQGALDHLKQELKALRTGRANSSMLDKVTVEVYGSHVKLKEIASLSVPEARQIVVTPFDFSTANAIKKGIEAANLGVNPMIDGKVIRINIPPMDETVRKQIAKPVSYTHLDVYKRQRWRRSKKERSCSSWEGSCEAQSKLGRDPFDEKASGAHCLCRSES